MPVKLYKNPFALDKDEVESTPKTDSSLPEIYTTPEPSSSEIKTPVAEGVISRAQVDDIATKYALTKEQKEEMVDYVDFFGGEIEGRENSFSGQAKGFLADSLALGIPQAAAIESQDTEEMKNALNDLRQLSESNKSWTRTGAEIATGMLLPGGAALKAGGKLAKLGTAATLSGVESATRADRHSRVEAGALGAVAGAALGVAGEKIFDIAKTARNKMLRAEAQNLDELIESPHIEKMIDDKYIKDKPRNKLDLKMMRSPEKLSDKEIRKLLGGRDKMRSSMEALKGSVPLHEIVPTLIEQQRNQLLNRVNKDLRQDVTGKFEGLRKQTKGSLEGAGDSDKILDSLERQGNLELAYSTLRKKDIATDVLLETDKLDSTRGMSVKRQMAFFFSDNIPVAKIFDETHGTDSHLLLSKASRDHVEYSDISQNTLTELKKISAAAKKKEVDPAKLYKYLEGKEPIPPSAKKEVKEYRKFIEGIRKFANSKGMKIPKVENYVPLQRVPAPQYKVAAMDAVDHIKDKYGINIQNIKNDADFDKLHKESGTFRILVNETKLGRGGTAVSDAREFKHEFNNMMSDPEYLNKVLSLESFAAKARNTTHDVPDLFRETDVDTLLTSWVHSTNKALAHKETLATMSRYSDLAEKTGDMHMAKFWHDLGLDIKGARSGTMNSLLKKWKLDHQTNMLLKARKETDPIRKKMYELGHDTPEILGKASQFIYHNTIALNPKSLLQNLTSPAMGPWADFGGAYGGQVWGRALGEMVNMKRQGGEVSIKVRPHMAKELGVKPGEELKTNSYDILLRNEGYLPRKWTGEGVENIRQGVAKSSRTELTEKALDAYSHKVMMAFEATEKAARIQSIFMGREMGKDMFKSSKIATDILSKVDSAAYKRKIHQLYKEGNVEGVSKTLGEYINSNNMFNYDKVSMSAYGRFMGPLFSTFTKWPTSIAGRVMSEYERKGTGKGTKQIVKTLMAPYMVLTGVDYLTQDIDNEVLKKVKGRGGFRSWTPADAAIGLFKEPDRLAKSPAMSAAINTLQTVTGTIGKTVSGDVTEVPETLAKGVWKTVKPFTPFVGPYKALHDDVYYRLLQNEDPKYQ